MKKTPILFLSLLTAAFVSCGGGTDKPSTKVEGPKLVSTTPAEGETEVATTLSVVFTYDQNVKCPQENKAQVSVTPEATIVSVGAYNTDLIVKLEGLEDGTKYTVTVPAGVVLGFKQNQEGAAMASVSFTTKEAPLPPVPEDVTPTDDGSEPWKMAKKLGLGWNMGNHFDAFYNYAGAGDKFLWPSETVWGNGECTRSTFTGLRSAGFNSIRIPITWLKTIGPAPDYKIDETWMNRIKEVVGWARDAGLNVIINTHHDEDHYLGSESMGHRWQNIMEATTNANVNAKVKEQITGVWTNIANEFKNEGDYLIFEGFNEINDGKWGNSANSYQQARILNEWNQTFVDAVRATGGNNATRWLGCPTYCASPSFINAYVLPTDPAQHTMLAVHCYDPYSYTLDEAQWEQWGHTAATGKYDQWGGGEKELRDVYAKLYSNFVAKGIPVYMGECGCSMRDYSNTTAWKFYKYYMEYNFKCAKTFGIPAFVWDNGNEGFGAEHHAYINHATGAFIGHSKEIIDIMVKATNTTDPNYTLESIYNNGPK